MHYQPGEDFLLSSKLGGSILFLSEHLGLCSQLFSFLDLADDADQTLFNSMLKKQHCLQVSLPEDKSLHLRQKGHMFDLPRCIMYLRNSQKMIFAAVFV